MKKQLFYSEKKNDIKINFFLKKEFIPKDKSFEKLDKICKEYPINKKIICLPDLNFKVKNFIPSGIVVPTKKKFFPSLLGTGNDGMILLKLKLNKEISSKDINNLFVNIKSKIAIFRRNKPEISEKSLLDLLFFNIKDTLRYFGFNQNEDHEKFEYLDNKFSQKKKILRILKKKKFNFKFPNFVPHQSIIKRSSYCIGVLDGTSHFIELYKVKTSAQKINSYNYYILIHAGSADPGIIIQNYLLDKENKKMSNNSFKNNSLEHQLLKISYNFGFLNRIYIASVVKKICEKILESKKCYVDIVNDKTHDFLDFYKDVFFHRKGAVNLKCDRNPQRINSEIYFLPTYLGGDGYILKQMKKNHFHTLNTVNHGVGRIYNKDVSLKKFSKIPLNKTLKNKVKLFRYYKDNIKSQMSLSFKNDKKIIKFLQDNKIAKTITTLKPIASLKA